MTPAWVDSSFWFALANRDEPGHPGATELLRGYDGRLQTSTFVMAETASLLTKRGTKAGAVGFCWYVLNQSACEVTHPSSDQVQAAWDLFLSRPDWDFDFVDSLSFTMMRDLEIETALTFDHHFAEMGFTTLPA